MPGKVGELYIDVNGEKGPSIHGRDLFNFDLYNDGTLQPKHSEFYQKWNGANTSWRDSASICGVGAANNYNSNSGECAARIMDEGWQMKY